MSTWFKNFIGNNKRERQHFSYFILKEKACIFRLDQKKKTQQSILTPVLLLNVNPNYDRNANSATGLYVVG